MTIDDGLAEAEPFFTRQGDLLVPNACALGPWASACALGQAKIPNGEIPK